MIHVYTDGGCSGNPGPGGWAYVIIRGDDQSAGTNPGSGEGQSVPPAENWGAEKSTTNNRMELRAVISALEYLAGHRKSRTDEPVIVYTDSQYVQKGMTLWMKDWKLRKWKTSAKEPVKNQDLWQQLDALAAEFSVTWTWVKGHAGNVYNERCDELTQKAIASL